MSEEKIQSNEVIPETPDLLIVLGKNIGVDSSPADIRKDPSHLSADSRINVLAAGMSYKPGMKILLSSGHTAGQDYPSEAGAMRRFLRLNFPDIPDADVMLEEVSIDTASNAKEVGGMIDDKDYERIAILSTGYHVQNASTLFENYGVRVDDTVAAEDILRARSPGDERYVKAWKELDRIKKERRNEILRKLLLSTMDRKGKWLRRLVTSRTRG